MGKRLVWGRERVGQKVQEARALVSNTGNLVHGRQDGNDATRMLMNMVRKAQPKTASLPPSPIVQASLRHKNVKGQA